MSPTAKDVRQMFASIAPRYDLLNHLLSFQIDKFWRYKTVRASRIRPGASVLDLCAGTGDLSFAFAKHEAKVIGADFCPEMIHLAMRKRGKRGGAKFIVADSLQLPFADNSFDAVAVAFGIRNLQNWRHGIAEMARVAKPGAKILILEFAQPDNRLFRKFYHFYFLQILPRVGRWISGNKTAYQYLPDSVLSFASPHELMQAMQAAGLGNPKLRRLSGGIAVLLCAEKQYLESPNKILSGIT